MVDKLGPTDVIHLVQRNYPFLRSRMLLLESAHSVHELTELLNSQRQEAYDQGVEDRGYEAYDEGYALGVSNGKAEAGGR